MKKIKNITTSIASITICLTLLIVSSVNADEITSKTIYLSDSTYYMECEELYDYFGSTKNIYLKSVASNGNRFVFIVGQENGTGDYIYSTADIDPSRFYFLSEEKASLLEEYIASAYPDITLELISEGASMFNYEIEYNNISFSEKLKIAKNIKENTGIEFMVQHNSDLRQVLIVEDAIYTPGDLNQSGTPDMSDAVSLMAHATNPEAYPLTDLQILLGDVYQQGDGIGINDAVSIQKYLTKQIDSLPESTM